MNEYKELSNLSENIMIRDLREAISNEDKEEKNDRANEDKSDDSQLTCVFCGSKESFFIYMGKSFCRECYKDLRNMKSD